jgi:hypothetical protein
LGALRNSSDTAQSALIWWPHVERDDLFQRFDGCIIAAQAGNRTLLCIEGTADGGTAPVTDSVLARLLAMIGGAIAADSASSVGLQTDEG